MILETVLDTLNVLASLIVAGIITYKLTALSEKFTIVESVGMGLIAAGVVMTIGPITFKPSPYDDWSGTVMRVGLAVYFVGRMTRHRWNNYLQRRQAEKLFGGKP